MKVQNHKVKYTKNVQIIKKSGKNKGHNVKQDTWTGILCNREGTAVYCELRGTFVHVSKPF